MKTLKLLLSCALLLVSVSVNAQTRTFPGDAPRGYLSPPSASRASMLLNDKNIALTPGAQIRDESNVIVFPSMVRQNSIVKYQLENGALHRAWILTPDEILQPDVHKLPTRVLPAND